MLHAKRKLKKWRFILYSADKLMKYWYDEKSPETAYKTYMNT
jgi:hypothetical protein